MSSGGTGTLRVAVIGVGHLGRVHAKIYAESPKCELVGVCDLDEAAAQEVAQAHGCQALGGFEDLPEDLDAVSIVVPTTMHAPIAEAMLRRGVGCLVEKPMALSIKKTNQILTAAEAGGATLAVGHVERFQPGVRKVHELGIRPRFVECHRLTRFSFRSTDVSVVHDLMIHDLDLVLDLMGTEIAEVDAVGGTILTQSEDIASVRLTFADGGRANISASRVSLKPMRRFRLFSNDGYVSLDFQDNEGMLVRRGAGWEKVFSKLANAPENLGTADLLMSGVFEMAPLELSGEERPLQAELASFLDCVANGTQPEVTGEDGRRALALAERISHQIKKGGW